jgi:hypothetical protein
MTKIQTVTLKIPEELVNRAYELSRHLHNTPDDVLVDWLMRGSEIDLPVSLSQEAETLSLYTIGHSNLSIEEFISALETHHIQVLIDVRSVPASRYSPHFNRAPLEKVLREYGIEYRFAGEYLGGRPDDPTVYKNQGVPDKSTKREEFLELVQYDLVMKTDRYLTGLRGLLQIVREHARRDQNAAIMCSEGNPLECHRHHLIARSLIDPKVKPQGIVSNVQIYHILRDKNLQLLNPNVFKEPPRQQQLL